MFDVDDHDSDESDTRPKHWTDAVESLMRGLVMITFILCCTRCVMSGATDA